MFLLNTAFLSFFSHICMYSVIQLVSLNVSKSVTGYQTNENNRKKQQSHMTVTTALSENSILTKNHD